MKSVIPFKKEIEFKTKIAEITSISLEHEYVKKIGEVSGDFIVDGEYKIHELSVNKEKFKYRLPFNIELAENIDLDSLNLQILDFTYDVVDEDKLEVFIEFGVEAAEKEVDEVLFEKPEERETIEKLLEKNEEERVEEVVEEKINDDISEDKMDKVNDSGEEERINVDDLENQENTYVTYHIHIVKENESVEGICKLYNTTNAILGEYNDLSNLVVGDKLIIPEYVDE